ncbi:DUF1827 family protein [Enterococcus sp. HY326]|uniref:DUF1827 family protein n=1 Tax=Enterococcus sp. HY326 TaxID=2971265 RepID=UPI0022408A56|nr:DUF1827 family protein [Enterococcus sp. HY326]
MKLIKSQLNTSVSLRRVYPIICSYLFDNVRIKSYEIYTLDRTTILKVDTFDSIVLVLFNKSRKIEQTEIDFVCDKLLAGVKGGDCIYLDGVLEKMAAQGLEFTAKDFVVIQKAVTQD